MFPLNPNIGRAYVTSSASSTREHDLREVVATRDGHRCVLTGVQEIACDAVHLLGHSKGDKVRGIFLGLYSLTTEVGDSTSRLILIAVVETPSEATKSRQSTASGTAFFSTPWLTEL